MKKIDYDEYKRQNKKKFRQIILSLDNIPREKKVRTRPRDKAEEEVLTKLAVWRWNRALLLKDIEILAPGRYRVNVFKRKD